MSSRRISNYQITDYVGSGGFGSVFKAADVNTPGRVVAIKELHKKHTRNSVIKQRFFQEAVAMARLDHPNLPRLYTFGEDNGSYYLVMEFISGRLLSEELHDDGPIMTARAVSILTQVLEAVSYAHRNGIIHRDLKPDNIILTEDGGSPRIKVLDFGIARMVGGENLTLTGEGFGTPAYMSPERISGAVGDDPRIDIYSAGIILFEMLTGKRPFQSHATDPVIYWSEMRSLHTLEPLPPLARPGVSDALDQVARRATAKNVEDRYASADEMLADLKKISGDVEGAASAPVGIASVGIPPVARASAGSGAARLLLTTVPGAADVYVDDTLRGSSDAMRGKILIEGLAPGLHSVRVAKAGYSEYRISVSLEEGDQTDLQVALPARATVAMPIGESTAAAGFDTIQFQAGDDARTALLVVESLPAGSTLFIGSDPVARADEDGRATVRLNPGSYEIKATGPAGLSAKSLVTVSAEETGSLKTITLPLLSASTTAPATGRDAGSAGKRMAALAVVVLLLALAVASYFVLRGPDRGDAPVASTPAPVTQSQAGATPSAAPDTTSAQQAGAQAQAEAKSVAEERQRTQAEAEKARAEKASAEKLSAENASAEKKLAEKKNAAPEQAASVAPSPPVSPAPQPQPAPAAQDACVGVIVTGGMSNRFRVRLIERPETSSASVINGQTNNRGMWYSCGFKAGNRMRVVVFGMKGALRASREVTLTPGRNAIEIQASEQPGVAPELPYAPGRRRPRFQRP